MQRTQTASLTALRPSVVPAPASANGMTAQLKARSAKTEVTIECLLDWLESDVTGESLMGCMKAREDERDALRVEIVNVEVPTLLII